MNERADGPSWPLLRGAFSLENKPVRCQFYAMTSISMEAIRALSVQARIQLAEDIWDTIPAEGETISISGAMREELDGRLEDHENDPQAGERWEDVKRRLEQR